MISKLYYLFISIEGEHLNPIILAQFKETYYAAEGHGDKSIQPVCVVCLFCALIGAQLNAHRVLAATQHPSAAACGSLQSAIMRSGYLYCYCCFALIGHQQQRELTHFLTRQIEIRLYQHFIWSANLTTLICNV